jgi:hypothetical protein
MDDDRGTQADAYVDGYADGMTCAMKRAAIEARRYASHYPEASDGRNTFILFAEWAEREATHPPSQEIEHDDAG